MRILHVLDHSLPIYDGYSFRSAAILREQHALGLEVAALTGPKQGAVAVSEEVIAGLKVYRTPTEASAVPVPGMAEFSLVRSLRRRIREVVSEFGPDIVHVHSPALNALAALGVGAPMVYEVRAFWEDAAVDNGKSEVGSIRYRLTRSLESFVLSRSSAIVALCDGVRGDLVARGHSPSKISVVPNAVNVADFKLIEDRAVQLREQLGLGGRVVFGFIGSFYPYEGLPLLVKAIAMLRAAGTQAAALLVGGGQQDAELRAMVESMGLGADCVFAGRVPHMQVRDFYAAMDYCVFPRLRSRQTELVTPLKPLEAMAMGIPVLASDVGGHRELVQHGHTGVLFDADNAEALAICMQGVIDKPGDLNAIRVAARRFVEEERCWPNTVRTILPVYQRLAEANSAR